MKVIDCVTVEAGYRPVTTVWFDGTIPVHAFRFAIIDGERYEAFPVMGKDRHVVDIIASGNFTGKEISFE